MLLVRGPGRPAPEAAEERASRKVGGSMSLGVNLSEVICWRCNKPLGSNRTLVFDADGDKRYSTKGMWRHDDCDEVPDMRPDGE